MEFPQYRKYPNNKSYFKVLSANSFEEIQILGKSKLKTRFEAKIHPDRVLIQDMLGAEENWQVITAEEYEGIDRSTDS